MDEHVIRSLGRKIARFFQAPELPADARRTFRFHLAYALLDAAAGGIVLNAPMVALKALSAQTWHLPLRELYSGIGMLATLYLGSWMAPRLKMPFVFYPGVACAACALGMAMATGSAFWFLTLFGISAMFEIVTRPAITAILRLNYPVTHRGQATGEVRKWSSLSFVVASLSSAVVLQSARADNMALVQGLILLAGALSLSSFLCFRRIRVIEDPAACRRDLRPEVFENFRRAASVVLRDARYRRYLLACFADGFCGMLYFPLIWAFLQKTLGYGYVGSALLMHVIPAMTAFALTGMVGRWFDRTNPWLAWAWIRFGWGLDALLLAATPWYAATFPPALVLLPVAGRLLRGAVQGGQWVLWWQIGVTHFARPGEDTSRYMGIMVFLSGAIRLTASAMGMVLAAEAFQPGALLVGGGVGVILSGVYSLWQGMRERRQEHLATIADFESQFGAGARSTSTPIGQRKA